MKKISACRIPALFVLLIAVSGQAWATGGSAVIPLTIGDRSFDAEQGTIRFSITNRSNRIVTAWGFTIVAADATGTEQILGWGEDFFLTAVLDEIIRNPAMREAATVEDGPLAPGSRRYYERTLSLLGPTRFHIVSVAPTFAILDDRSSVGDPASLGTILADRSGALEANSAVLRVLESLDPTDPEAVTELVKEVGALKMWAAEKVKSELTAEIPVEADRLQRSQSRHAYLESIEEIVFSLNEKARERPFDAPELLSYLRSNLASQRHSSLNGLREAPAVR